MSTLGEELPREMARVRELQGEYRAIGSSGCFGVAMMEAALQRADKATISGDLPAMIRAWEELKEFG